MNMTNAEARRRLQAAGITSATVLTGSSTITIDTSAFDSLLNLADNGRILRRSQLSNKARARLESPDAPRVHPVHQPNPKGTIA